MKIKQFVFDINGEEMTVITRKSITKAMRKAVQKYLRKSKVEEKMRNDKKLRLDIRFVEIRSV
jgi:hypothetical protein